MKLYVNDTPRNVTALKAAKPGWLEVSISADSYSFKSVGSYVIPRDFLISEAMVDEFFETDGVVIRRYR